MRIAVVTNGYPPDSASLAYVHARVKAYKERGHQVIVFVRERRGSPSYYATEGVDVCCLGVSRAVREVVAFAPHVVAVHAPHRWSMSVAGRLPFPQVSWIHGHEALSLSSYQGNPGALRRALFYLYDLQKLWRLKRFLERCRAVVFVSQWMRDQAENHSGYNHPTSLVIPNPVDTTRFAPLKDAPSLKGDLRGVSIRNLTSAKYGLDVAIKAYSRMEETSLTIIGTGPLEDTYRRLIEASESNTAILSQRFKHDDMPGVFNRYDYFVAPSRLEAQGVAMCEAMACGLPVVATNVGGIPEFVTNGLDGCLVAPDNAQALRAAILQLVRDKKSFERYARRAREHVTETCDVGKIVERELETLEDVCASREH